MLLKILRDTVADGKTVKADEIIEMSERTGTTLLLLGKAERCYGAVYEEKIENHAKESDGDLAQADPDTTFSVEMVIEGEDDLGMSDPDLAPQDEAQPEKTTPKESKKDTKKPNKKK